jgi:CheY-like chemotaxis protein/curved DNA-binding protein CbpA
MQKSDLNILIVEDDQTLGKALREVFTRAGFKAVHVTKPDEALATLKLQSFNAAVIDCMLPKMNGRDLAKKVRLDVSADFPIILMSGIYKDKNFAREAIQETGAIAFLNKPFDLASLVKIVENRLEHVIEVPLAGLQELFTKHEASHKERVRAINETEEVHAFELPWIYSLLFHPRINGHLNIINSEGEVSGVGFQRGNIVQVNQKDAKSYFGVLMVENGFITQAEIEEVMKASGRTKQMGERLVEANMLSPHAITIVMAEQQGLRLSKTIANTSVKVNFIDSDDIRVDAVVDRTAYSELLNEWLNSKVTLSWLKSTYLPWMRYNIQAGPEFTPTHRCLTLPVVARVKNICETLIKADTLESALASLKEPEDDVYRALHILVISRLVRFGELRTATSFDAQRQRLTKIDASLDKQNYFERLGVSQKAKESEVKRSYHELAKILHPDKLSPAAPTDLRDLARLAFGKISQAYEVLSSPAEKERYIMELEKGRAEFVLEAEQLTEEARILLSKGDIRKGRELIEKAVSLAPPSSETMMLFIWAKLKTPGVERDITLVDSIRNEIAKIPPEDRHVSTYYFIKGLMQRASNELEAAKRSLEHAVSIAPDFIDARRELAALNFEGAKNKPTDLLRGDLKDVIGMLFKKKK